MTDYNCWSGWEFYGGNSDEWYRKEIYRLWRIAWSTRDFYESLMVCDWDTRTRRAAPWLKPERRHQLTHVWVSQYGGDN